MDFVREVHLDDMAAARRDMNARVENQMALAQKGLGAMMIANGGALIGLFTFVGNAVSKDAAISFNLALIWWAFAVFSFGVVAVLVALLMAFMSQQEFHFMAQAEVERLRKTLALEEIVTDQTGEYKHFARGNYYYLGGVVAALISIIAFLIGAGLALSGVLPA